MLGLKKIASLAGKAAESATKTAEAMQIDSVTLPRLYAEIGKWIVQHPKLPPDLAQRREEILLLQAAQSEAPQSPVSQTPSGIAERAKQLAGQAGHAAASVALAAKIRSAHVALGQYAWSKYREKVLPKPVAEEFKAVMTRRQELSGAASRVVVSDDRPKPAKNVEAKKTKLQMRGRQSSVGLRLVLASIGFGALLAGAYGGWRVLSTQKKEVGQRVTGDSRAKPKPVAGSALSSGPTGQAVSFLSDRHDLAVQLLFPKVLPGLGTPGAKCQNVMLNGGKLLTVIDNNNIELTCVIRGSDGAELARRTVSGNLEAHSGLNSVIACGDSASLVVKRGRNYHCVMLGSDGAILWETEPLSSISAVSPLGADGILVAANLLNAPVGPSGESPFGALYRWDAKGRREWGHEGGGPFLGSLAQGPLEVFEGTNRQLMLATDGVVAVTVNGFGPVPSPRVAVSTDAKGKVLAFIPRLSSRLETGEKRKHPMLRGVLRDGRIVAQDPYDMDTLVVFGAEGKEVMRKRLGVCIQARSCRDSDDVFFAVAAGADTRLVRLRPDGSEAWQVSLQERIPGAEKTDFRAFLSETLLELPKGGLLWTCREHAVVVDRKGTVVACARAKDAGGQAELGQGGKVLWPSIEGPCLVGEIARWPAS